MDTDVLTESWAVINARFFWVTTAACVDRRHCSQSAVSWLVIQYRCCARLLSRHELQAVSSRVEAPQMNRDVQSFAQKLLQDSLLRVNEERRPFIIVIW